MTLTVACTFDRTGLDDFDRTSHAGEIDLLVLPELFDGGYAQLSRGGTPADQTNALLQRFADMSQRHRLNLIGGSLAMADSDGQIRNTCVVFSQGKEVGRVTKTHLFRPLHDDRYFVPGHPGSVLSLTAGGRPIRTGVMICYDLRFPEIARPWFKQGLDLLIVPARWPRARDELWKTLLRARAIENQCFAIGVDSRDEEGGGTYAFGPAGEPIHELGPEPNPNDPPWIRFDINLDDIRTVKERLDTRPDAILL